MSLANGTIVADDYRIEAPLAQGGMGAVFIATQLSTGRRRALKVMHPTMVLDVASRERFLEEARIGSRIESEHVVEVVGAGIDTKTGAPWLAVELLEGETLDARIRARGGITCDALAKMVVALRHALGRAHALGIVHRDLKPENIFLARGRGVGEDEKLVILDFGIAKLLTDGKTAVTQNIAGSPMWMAPEQADGHAIRPSTDVWALGLIAFYALTSVPYWRAASVETTLTKLLLEVLAEPLEPASVRAASLAGESAALRLPVGFDAFFARAVDRDPKARYANATEALDALERVLRGEADTLPRSSVAFDATMVSLAPPPPRRSEASPLAQTGAFASDAMAGKRRTRAVSIALAAFAVAAAAVLLVTTREATRSTPPVVATNDVHAPSVLPDVAMPTEVAPAPPAEAVVGAPPPPMTPETRATAAPARVPAPIALAPAATAERAVPSETPSEVPSDAEMAWSRSEASRFRSTVVSSCWSDNLAADTEAAQVTVTLGFGAMGNVTSVRIDGTTNTAFRQCTVLRGTSYRVSTPPMTDRLVVRASLPAASAP